MREHTARSHRLTLIPEATSYRFLQSLVKQWWLVTTRERGRMAILGDWLPARVEGGILSKEAYRGEVGPQSSKRQQRAGVRPTRGMRLATAWTVPGSHFTAEPRVLVRGVFPEGRGSRGLAAVPGRGGEEAGRRESRDARSWARVLRVIHIRTLPRSAHRPTQTAPACRGLSPSAGGGHGQRGASAAGPGAWGARFQGAWRSSPESARAHETCTRVGRGGRTPRRALPPPAFVVWGQSHKPLSLGLLSLHESATLGGGRVKRSSGGPGSSRRAARRHRAGLSWRQKEQEAELPRVRGAAGRGAAAEAARPRGPRATTAPPGRRTRTPVPL